MQQVRKLAWDRPADDSLGSAPSVEGLGSSVIAIEKALRAIGANDSVREPSKPKRDFSQYMERMRRAAAEIRAAHQRVQTAEARVNALAQKATQELEAAEARVETAEARARDAELHAQDAEARAQAAEARAREAEARAQADEEFLVQLHETIVEPLAASLEQSPPR